MIKCFHVPPAICLCAFRGTHIPGWESLAVDARPLSAKSVGNPFRTWNSNKSALTD